MSTVLLHRGWLIFWGDEGTLPIKWNCCRNDTAFVVEDWLQQVWSRLCLVYLQHRQCCSDAVIPGWYGCHLLFSGIPWHCSKAHTHVQTCSQRYFPNIYHPFNFRVPAVVLDISVWRVRYRFRPMELQRSCWGTWECGSGTVKVRTCVIGDCGPGACTSAAVLCEAQLGAAGREACFQNPVSAPSCEWVRATVKLRVRDPLVMLVEHFAIFGL